MPEFQTPPGTFDVLPPASARYEALLARFAVLVGAAGYGLVVSPMFEDIGVFQRLGASTDIVKKEMYDFRDKGDRHVALRPEGTASVVRAFVQHRPALPFKAWYAGPNFRYDRPQAGRYRQHHQVGIEALGPEDADLDVEVIGLAARFFADLGITQVRLDLNSLGDAECRPAYREALTAYLAEREDSLCDEHRAGYKDNPLRVLDCKKPPCVAATQEAPRMVEHLCDPCAAHFARVKDGLAALGIPFHLETRLVRGQDYYTRTTFEFAGLALEAAQNGIGGGGRYDGLVESLGGPPTAGVGFGLGIERIMLACDAESAFAVPETQLDVFVIDTTGGAAARDITHQLRAEGVRADRAWDNRSFKAQLKAALKSGAPLGVVAEEGRPLTIRTLQEKGEPIEVEPSKLVQTIKERIS